MIKKIVLLLTLFSFSAQAGLPPTTSKGVGDSAPVATFNYQFPNFAITHTGTTASLGVLGVTGGGTGNTTGTATINANLTGPITSVGNATSVASQTGTGTKFVMDTSPTLVTPNIGTATGSASLNVLKAGDTTTGSFTNSFAGVASTPALSLTGTPFAAGTATTNKPALLLEDAASSAGWSLTGTYLGVNAKTGFTGNLLDLQLNGVTKLNVSSGGALTAVGNIQGAGFTMSGALNMNANNSTLVVGNVRSFTSANQTQIQMANQTNSATSGTAIGLLISPTYNQLSGNSANTDVVINRTETAIGSGAQKILDLQVASASKFSVSNTGALSTTYTSGFLKSDSAGAITSAAGAAQTASDEISNLGLTATVAASALTINLKQADGSTAPSTGTAAVTIGFRNSTAATGGYNQRSATAANSLVISSGSTLGQANATAEYIYVYAIDNAGTVELAASTGLFIDEASVITTTAEGGAGAADSRNVIYSTTARTGVPIRLIGRIKSTQATAGTWAAAPSEISVVPFPYASLSSSTSSQERIERVRLSAVCTTGTCAIADKTPGISSVTWGSTGSYTVAFAAGTFSAGPTCAVSENQGTNQVVSTSGPSSSQVSVTTILASNNTFANGQFSLICMGPR